MIDTLLYQLEKLDSASESQSRNTQRPAVPFAVVTLHRPSNVDHKDTFQGIIQALAQISVDMPVLFPAHPRTTKNMEAFGLSGQVNHSQIKITPPMPYIAFLRLWKDASLVLTDSGGLQEETTALGVPCFTIRENTERPVTIEEGTNVLVGTTMEGIIAAYEKHRKGEVKRGSVPPYWDGKTSERIIDILLSHRS